MCVCVCVCVQPYAQFAKSWTAGSTSFSTKENRNDDVKRRRVQVRPIRSFHCTAYSDRRSRTRDWRVVPSVSIFQHDVVLSDRHRGRSFPRSAICHWPGCGQSWRLRITHQLQSRRKNENERCFCAVGWAEGSRTAAAQCKTHQNLKFSEISRLAGRLGHSLVAIFC